MTVPVIRVYDEGSSWDYSFAPFLVIAKDGTVYCFNTLVWRDDQLFAGHVTRTWKDGKDPCTASGTVEVK